MRERDQRRPLLVALWTAIFVQVAGQVLDLRWHAAHDEFESASDQVQAHWLIWAGAALTLVVAILGARDVPSRWYTGYRLLLLATLFYIASAGWHFGEHYNLRDPALPHVLLGIGKAAMLAGAISATLVTRKRTMHRRRLQPSLPDS